MDIVQQLQQQPQQLQPRRRKIDCKPELVISSLQKFYGSYADIESILPYLQGTADLSLRLIDWFVTNYCRKHFIGYPLNGQEFLVYISYKSQLKAYSKQYFDPNCRRERIMFQIPGFEPFLTTVGKLNFFRWAIETKLIDYIEEHLEEIQVERNEAMKTGDKKSRGSSTESSVSSQTSIRTVSTVGSAASAESAASAATVATTVSAADTVGSATTATTATTAASADSSFSLNFTDGAGFATTRRRRSKQIPAASRQLQKHECSITVTFD